MNDFAHIIGGHGTDRHENDFYVTPPEVTLALLHYLEERGRLKRDDIIWDPACGDGAMVRAILSAGYICFGTDIVPQGSYEHDEPIDFLKGNMYAAQWIITNPPFSKSVEFIRKAASMRVPFAFLLKTQYWHSASRLPLFREIRPTDVLPLTWRPDFKGNSRTGLMDFVWVVWDANHPRFTIYEPLEKPEV